MIVSGPTFNPTCGHTMNLLIDKEHKSSGVSRGDIFLCISDGVLCHKMHIASVLSLLAISL